MLVNTTTCGLSASCKIAAKAAKSSSTALAHEAANAKLRMSMEKDLTFEDKMHTVLDEVCDAKLSRWMNMLASPGRDVRSHAVLEYTQYCAALNRKQCTQQKAQGKEGHGAESRAAVEARRQWLAGELCKLRDAVDASC